jgi:hypothetical protein
MGVFSGADSMGVACLALSPGYRMPQVLYEIAADLRRAEMVNRQRMGIKLAEAKRWGLGFENFEDGMVFLSLEAYTHPRTVQLIMRMFDAFNWWENDFFAMFRTRRRLLSVLRRFHLLPLLVSAVERDVTRNTREEVNIYTYRTPDYLLSSALDYRPGCGGDQQHIWQATLGPDAVCFTTHPARRHEPSPSYWTGSGSLPRVAQVKNVVIAIYDVDTRPGVYVTHRLRFTHAWLPRDHFDETVEAGGWICARRGDGYLALRAQHPYRWQTEPGENRDCEVIVEGTRTVWICEVGRRAVDGEFAEFVARIVRASVTWGDRCVAYDSPSQGHIEFGWTGPLRVNGAAVPLRGYPRYDNPYVQASFPPEEIGVGCGGHWLRLNWKTAERQASAFV